MTNPYRQMLPATRTEQSLWKQYYRQWEYNNAAGYIVAPGVHVTVAVPVTWWSDKEGRPVFIARGNTGVIEYSKEMQIWYVKFDAIEHPRANIGQVCGMLQRLGDTLPGFLTYDYIRVVHGTERHS